MNLGEFEGNAAVDSLTLEPVNLTESANTLFYNNTIVLGPRPNLPPVTFNEWDGGNATDNQFTNNFLVVSEGGKAIYQFAANPINQR